jgi:hypothetical protein
MNSKETLLQWLEKRLGSEAMAWLRERSQRIAENPGSLFFPAFGQASRRAGKEPFHPEASEQSRAREIHPGWDLSLWTRADAARAVLLLSLTPGSKAVETVLALHQSADLGEHVSLARALFLLPDAPALLHVAREAIRSNMGDVFAAMARRNPYAAEHCDEIAWNQMVVKCLFVDVPLDEIQGLEARRNPALSRMILDLARERRAAHRPLAPEAWRCVDSGQASPEELHILQQETRGHA